MEIRKIRFIVAPFLLSISLIAAPIPPAKASNLEYKLENNRVLGSIKLADVTIKIDMQEPDPVPASVYQYKTTPYVLDEDKVLSALRMYGYDPSSKYQGQNWHLTMNDSVNNDLLLMYPDGGVLPYGAGAPCCHPTPVRPEVPAHVKANEVMKGFLDLIGLQYEYPFYACMYAFQLDQVEAPESLDDYWSYNPHMKKYGEMGNYTLIVARKLIDESPYVMRETRGEVNTFGGEVNNPYASALIDDQGKIVKMSIGSRWPEEVGRMEIKRPIFTWDEALKRLPNVHFWGYTLGFYRMDVIERVEFSYCLTEKGIATPVWSIMVKAWTYPSEKRKKMPPDKYNYARICFVIDAITGEAR